ncbi:MAG: J domain-containing protein [Mobilitalea sp.]
MATNICPNCGKDNNEDETLCDCGYRLNRKEKRRTERTYKEQYVKVISVKCKTCNKEIIIEINKNYNVFCCQYCRSIYSYENINGSIKIELEKKVIMIPDEVKKAYKILNLNMEENTIENIKKAWKKELDKYHPDKVSHLGEDLIKLAEEKSKSINEAYSIIKKYIK